MDRELIAPSFVPRDIPEGDMWLNPLAPAKPKPPAPPVLAAAAQAATTPVSVQPVVKEETPLVTPVATVVLTPPPANVPIFKPAIVLTASHPSSDL
jgi:hypothetical protein